MANGKKQKQDQQQQTYSGQQISDAYQQVFGRPYPNANIAAGLIRPIGGAYSSVTDPQGNQVSLEALMNQAQTAQAVQQLQQAAQGQQRQQMPSLSSMWNAYGQQGAQQAQGQQPTQTVAPSAQNVISQAVSQPGATPFATVPAVNLPSPSQFAFAPPPPPAPGQQEPQRLQQGGFVLPQNQSQPQQTYFSGQAPGNQISNLYNLYGISAVGAGALGGAPMVINPTPNQGPLSQGGVYTGNQLPTVYGTQQSSAPGASPSSLGQYTFPGGGQLTQDQMARFLQGTADEQQQVAAALGTTPGAILQAASNYQGGAQRGPGGTTAAGSWSVPNAQPQYVSSSANMPAGPWSVMPGVFNAAPMPTPTVATAPGITPIAPANAALARPGGTGVPWATAPMPGQTALPPSTVGAPTLMALSSPVPGLPPAAPAPGQGGGGVQISGATGSGFATAHNSALANAGMALYSHFGGDPSSATPADIANFHNQLTGTVAQYTKPPVKMQQGGVVPGVGDQDSVPALLTPGEYVIPKEEVQRQQGQQGQSSQTQVPALVPSLGGGNQANQLAQLMAQKTIAQNRGLIANQPMAMPAPATPGASVGPQASGYAAAANAGQIGGAAPSAAEVGRAASMTPAQTQASMTQANMPTAALASGIGALGTGLAQAAQTYASSIKAWTPQTQAFGPPPAAPSGPAAQFRQEQPERSQRQPLNPYYSYS
jgi:hypothetical protein